jgi:2-iminoacetate synthase
MAYLEGMETIDAAIMEEVLKTSAAYDRESYTQEDVRRALDAPECSVKDFAALLSPAAMPLLEELAQRAQRERRLRFGNGVYLFTPLYISNYCENHCVYCGFNCKQSIHRARLDARAIEAEMRTIAESGLEEVLILTGESPRMSGLEYLGEACRLGRKYFRVVGLEVYPLNSEEYAYLHQQGADFVTLFQETYDPAVYQVLHPGGRKRIFPYRFNAQERALKGGIRGVGFGALLGLADFRKDAFATGLHARLIQRKYPHGEIALSCPRLRPLTADASWKRTELDAIGEAELLQVICAYRLFMPYANITISSREGASFRDHAVAIAATKISAGVDVGIGGHAGEAQGDEQFAIADGRSVDAIYDMIRAQGLQPIMSDYLYV